MNDIRLKLAPPWITYINELEALLDGDPQIAFNVNEGDRAIIIACNDGDKCAALAKLLPEEVNFGAITFTITIDGPMSNRAFTSNVELYETAFTRNPAFAYAVCPAQDGYNWAGLTYVVFKNYVVQFFNDNLNDCHGVVSTLYQTIADEILQDSGLGAVTYNTDIEAKLGKSAPQWP